ncbi:MAG: DUF6152 family protein [Bryobacteraceae bacterium]
MRNKLTLGFGIAALALSTVPASAHHGWGGNLDEEFEISGTVAAPLSMAGPHATMKLKDAEGKVWDLTLAPPPRTDRAGLKEGIIPVGAAISIHGHRNRDMKKFEIKTERVTWNGKTFNVYPDRT